MIATVRGVIVVVLACHGLIHLLGVAKGFGWAKLAELAKPIGLVAGALWLLAAVLVLATAALLLVGVPTWWWVIALAAAAVSQVCITTSWDDARAGTVVNIILVLAAGYGFAAEGPGSFHAQYREHVARAIGEVDVSPSVLAESDLADLPAPLAAYIRRSGAVGQPRVVGFHADFHGRIRSGPDEAWMSFTGEQVNTYGPRPRRIFLMDATRTGLPVTVLHVFADASATMRVKLLSAFTMVDASGAEMDRGETVTVFNDLVVMAPGAIADADATWTAIDALNVRGDFTNGEQTVSAVLTFDADHDLVNFVSEDRSAASADGRSFTPQPWSTPIAGHRFADGRRILTSGQGVWHAAQPRGTFTYLEFDVDEITYDVSPPSAWSQVPETS